MTLIKLGLTRKVFVRLSPLSRKINSASDNLSDAEGITARIPDKFRDFRSHLKCTISHV